jgi:hypothetical protein
VPGSHLGGVKCGGGVRHDSRSRCLQRRRRGLCPPPRRRLDIFVPRNEFGEKAEKLTGRRVGVIWLERGSSLDATNRASPHLHTRASPPLAPHARRRFLGPSQRSAERRAVRRRRHVLRAARRPRPGRRQRPRPARGGVGNPRAPPRGRRRRRRALAARRARGARVDRDGVRRTTGMDGGPLDVLPIALRGDRPPVRPATRAAISTTLFGFFSDGRVVAFYRSRQTH